MHDLVIKVSQKSLTRDVGEFCRPVPQLRNPILTLIILTSCAISLKTNNLFVKLTFKSDYSMMKLLPIDNIQVIKQKVRIIDQKVRDIYRLITFSRSHTADDLLDSFIASNNTLVQLLSIKNAQMEAQTDEEAKEYLDCLNRAIIFVIGEIKNSRSFMDIPQLFQLFRTISPDAHAKHPNKFRQTIVQIGSTICPEPQDVPILMADLFRSIHEISHPITRAIYFHHELIRIHPFSDGNGRTTRIAQNWMLMYNLYPPIFIKDEVEKQEYIRSLNESFNELDRNSPKWNSATAAFFDQELERLMNNTDLVLNNIKQIGDKK